MLEKIYSGKNSDASFNGSFCVKCMISVIMLVTSQG